MLGAMEDSSGIANPSGSSWVKLPPTCSDSCYVENTLRSSSSFPFTSQVSFEGLFVLF